MADEATTSAEETQLTFHIKSSSDTKHTVTVPATTTVLELKHKLSTSEYADIPAERQRLIYSGRVLKDPDTLASVKIKDGHTVHMVKSAASNARQNPTGTSSTSTGSSGTTPAVPSVPNMAAGTGNDPLAGLTGARFAGFHGLPNANMFGPDGGIGGPPNPDQLLEMMDDPNFVQQMNEAMNNPAFIEMMRNSPMVRNNPMAQEMFNNPALRRMMLNPDMMRAQLQMQRSMNPSGAGGAFPMPGATDTTPAGQRGAESGTTGTGNTASPPPPNLFAMFGDPAAAGANPFANLFGPPPTGTGAGATGQTGSPPPDGQQGQQPPNPFAGLFGAQGQGQQGANPMAQMTQQMMQNPEAMRAALQLLGGGMPGAGSPPAAGTPGTGEGTTGTGTGSPPPANPFAALMNPYGGVGGLGGLGGYGGMGGVGSPPPQDTRPPEERYAEQLRQLNDMGFYEFDRNVQALRRSGGSVQGAIEYLLSGS